MYARAFALWFGYSGLAEFSGQTIEVADEAYQGEGELLGPPQPFRGRVDAIHISPGPVLALLNRIIGEDVKLDSLQDRERRHLHLLIRMALVRVDSAGSLEALDIGDGGVTPGRVRIGLEQLPGVSMALAELEQNSRASAAILGQTVKDATNAIWGESTARLVGKHIRSWARRAGLKVT
jgi:hypothetical protein